MSQPPSLGGHRSTLPRDSEEQPTSIANERTISLVPVDPFDSVQSVEAAMAESQASAAATLVALLVACDGDDEAFDRSTIPFKNSSERRTFVLELEALFEATHVWVRDAGVHQAKIGRLESLLSQTRPQTQMSGDGVRSVRLTSTSTAVPEGSIIDEGEEGEAAASEEADEHSSIDGSSNRGEPEVTMKPIAAMENALDGWSSDDEGDLLASHQTKQTTALVMMTKATRDRFEQEMLVRKSQRDALVRKCEVRCECIKQRVQEKMPRSRTTAELQDKAEYAQYKSVLRQTVSKQGSLLEHMLPFAAAAFETQWGQGLADYSYETTATLEDPENGT